MSKKIGILTWPVGRAEIGITVPYYDYFEQFGDVALVTFNELRYDLDLLVLPGGPDVNPERYGEKAYRRTTNPCLLRESFDMYVLPHYLESKVPVLGICRGYQTLAVHYGGKLLQHAPHETNPFDNRKKRVHNIVYKYDTTSLLVSRVNSIHHQVVSDDNFPDTLQVIARRAVINTDSKDANNVIIKKVSEIEAFIHKTEAVAGVQWHPEELMDHSLSNALVKDLLSGNFNNDKYEHIFKEKEALYSKNQV